MTDWLEIANIATREGAARKIIRDSDGNPARLAYRAGAAEAAAAEASKQISSRAAIDAIVRTLEQYEEVTLSNPVARITS